MKQNFAITENYPIARLYQHYVLQQRWTTYRDYGLFTDLLTHVLAYTRFGTDKTSITCVLRHFHDNLIYNKKSEQNKQNGKLLVGGLKLDID